MAPQFRFGRNAIVRIAPVTPVDASGNATKPDAAAFQVLCAHNELTFGFEHTTMDIENFCTNGKTVAVRDGGMDATLEFGDITWVETDAAITIMKNAAFNGVTDAPTETGGMVWVEILPLGTGLSKPVFDLVIDVLSWEMTIPAKGAITVAHNTITVLEGPDEGTTPAA